MEMMEFLGPRSSPTFGNVQLLRVSFSLCLKRLEIQEKLQLDSMIQ